MRTILQSLDKNISIPHTIETLQENNVNKLIISIISGRCGSTFFANYTKQLGVHNSGREYFNELPNTAQSEKLEGVSFHVYLNNTLKHSVKNGCFYFQISPTRSEILEKIFFADEFLASNIDIKLNTILRKDLVAQAISYCKAIDTGVFHVKKNKAPRNYILEYSDTNLARVKHWIEVLKKLETKIMTLVPEGKKSLDFCYENMVSSMPIHVFKFCEHCDISLESLSSNTLKVNELTQKLDEFNDLKFYYNFYKDNPEYLELIQRF